MTTGLYTVRIQPLADHMQFYSLPTMKELGILVVDPLILLPDQRQGDQKVPCLQVIYLLLGDRGRGDNRRGGGGRGMERERRREEGQREGGRSEEGQ